MVFNLGEIVVANHLVRRGLHPPNMSELDHLPPPSSVPPGSTKNWPVLFLYFDGVLHPDPCGQDEAFASLHLLAAALSGYPFVDIVVSSAWREFHPINELKAFLGPKLGPRVVGITPVHEELSPGRMAGSQLQDRYVRQEECEAWLRKHRPQTQWLAIDDRP